MSIKDIDYDEIADAGAFRRSFATMIDIFIVFFVRMFFAQILASFWLSDRLALLAQDYKNFFDTEVIDSPDKVAFIQSHPVFDDILIFIAILTVIGSIYYAYLHSSNYHATIGKRLMKVEVLNLDYSKISFFKAFLIYYFSLVPIIYATYILSYTYSAKVSLMAGMFHNIYNIIFTLIIIALSATFSSGLRRHMGFDIVLKIVYLNNKTDSKYPWKSKDNVEK